MYKRNGPSILIILLLSISLPINSEGRDSMKWETYSREIDGLELNFSVFQMEGGNSKNIVYYFHGAGGDHLTWIESGRTIRDSWIQQNILPPIVIGFSFGQTWNVTPENTPNDPLMRIIKEEIFDFAESQYGPFEQTEGIGISMGGFNLLQVFLDEPEFFDKMLYISPAIADLNPYAPNIEVAEYIKKSGALTFKQRLKSYITGITPTDNIDLILGFWKDLVSDYDQWKDIDPFYRLDNLLIPPEIDIVVACSGNDAFGFYQGSQELYSHFLGNGNNSRLYTIKGERHLIFPPDEVLSFTDEF